MKNAFQRYIDAGNRSGAVWRRRESSFSGQILDLYVDLQLQFEGRTVTEGFGIEAKSSKQQRLYWSKNFRDGQINGLVQFCKDTGRTPLVAIEHCRGQGYPRKAYLMHADVILEKKQSGEKGITVNDDLLDDDRAIILGKDGSDYVITEEWSRFLQP